MYQSTFSTFEYFDHIYSIEHVKHNNTFVIKGNDIKLKIMADNRTQAIKLFKAQI